jgi:predicted flavoprotein YhiN
VNCFATPVLQYGKSTTRTHSIYRRQRLPFLNTNNIVGKILESTEYQQYQQRVFFECSDKRTIRIALVLHSGFELDTVWGNASKKLVRALATNLVACSVEVTGKGTFKDEFVTAGGVSLKHMNMKRMESKIHPGLFVCGELLNVDGVTGGFNFMNCWSTGYLAGHSAADYCHGHTTTNNGTASESLYLAKKKIA